MLTADQRRELEALEAEMRSQADSEWNKKLGNFADAVDLTDWADRIAAVLANGVEE